MQRLDKVLSEAGVASRSDLKKLIKRGHVTVDGNVVYCADFKVDSTSEICLDGSVVETWHRVVLLMNKPSGFVTSTEDPRDRTVMELIDEKYCAMGVVPAGRLDKDTEGLLILTNDGALIHSLISPKAEVEKKYYAEFEGCVSDSCSSAFSKGIVLKDGSVCKSAVFELISPSSCYVTIREGMYHQVKRMMASQGLHVTYLKRIQEGPYSLGDLPSGSVCDIT